MKTYKVGYFWKAELLSFQLKVALIQILVNKSEKFTEEVDHPILHKFATFYRFSKIAFLRHIRVKFRA